MIGLALKWLAYALVALAFFSAATAIFMYYTLNFGACTGGGDGCQTNLAALYAAGIGIVGFSVSAYAAHVIGKGFRDQEGD
ncbi:MAG: hypothetical protein AAFY82_04070 [Pseudomonadota bacterium]